MSSIAIHLVSQDVIRPSIAFPEDCSQNDKVTQACLPIIKKMKEEVQQYQNKCIQMQEENENLLLKEVEWNETVQKLTETVQKREREKVEDKKLITLLEGQVRLTREEMQLEKTQRELMAKQFETVLACNESLQKQVQTLSTQTTKQQSLIEEIQKERKEQLEQSKKSKEPGIFDYLIEKISSKFFDYNKNL